MTLTSIAASAVGQAVTATSPGINAQIYTADSDSVSFSPLAGALLTFAAPATGNATSGVETMNIVINEGTRVLMVMYATSTATSGVVNVYLNGSIAIS
jgi:hypothetical protein